MDLKPSQIFLHNSKITAFLTVKFYFHHVAGISYISIYLVSSKVRSSPLKELLHKTTFFWLYIMDFYGTIILTDQGPSGGFGCLLKLEETLMKKDIFIH